MVRAEAGRPDRPDFISIVTPNSTHYTVAKLALEHGFGVVCEKPLATNSRDAADSFASFARRAFSSASPTPTPAIRW